MKASDSGPCAFGGGPLAGDKWVRVLYLDEAGIGNIENDPFLVVAGVLIHADTQWMALAQRLESILRDATPHGSALPSHLHAKDIFHGSGEFDRKLWSGDRRFGLLAQIAGLPAEFDIPVVWSYSDRRDRSWTDPSSTPGEVLIDNYSACAMACLLKTEIFMRAQPNKSEVASVVLEQNHELQKRIPSLVSFLRNPGSEVDNLLPGWERSIPPRHIIDAPSCQPKTASNILQLADYCAFALKRRLQGAKRAEELTDPFWGQLLTFRDADDRDRSSSWNPKFISPTYRRKVEFKDGEFRLVA